MSTIYLVQAGVEYEASWPIKAFKVEAEANAFCEACEHATKSKPQWPHKTTNHPDWDAFCAIEEAAEKAHPAGSKGASADYFVVVEVDLVDEP